MPTELLAELLDVVSDGVGARCETHGGLLREAGAWRKVSPHQETGHDESE
jgi:hypothetical protein